MKDASPEMLSLFCGALERSSADERAGYLAAACGQNVELRERIEALLRAHEQAGGFLWNKPAVGDPRATVDDPISERPGTVIGPYKLLEQIGEGGFGVVFMAEQQQPVRRKVALKVIKPGMDTRQVAARFEAERQALAIMDHPHIAHVLDGGETASGRPYFVMELVRGIPITDFCDRNCLSIRERLELFVDVCQAVQHAHQKGIIHRDLKPSNVMVTLHDGTPVIKVIDFGIAKATGQQLTDKTLFTHFAQMIGTPLYMSPEQAGMSGLDVDTRSDIYSLGALLYELLTGTTPFARERMHEADYDEIRRIIREEEPARPSKRISTMGQAATTISTQRQSDPKRIHQLLRGELDWIVMKALEKDRNRRYETASALAADVQRYLHDEPVQAYPPSPWYRFRKFVRRHHGPVLASGAVLLLILVSLLVIFQVRQQAAFEQAANQEQARKRLELQLYYQTVGLVERERAAGNTGRAEQLLDGPQCPPHLRGWEWHYLKRLRYGAIPAIEHTCFLWSLAVSPDGRWLAAGGMDGRVRLWDVKSWREACSFQAHGSYAKGLAFSPDSRQLASGSWSEGEVKVWTVPAGELLTVLPQSEVTVSVAFSPDGRRLVSAGRPGIKVWDAVTWQQLAALEEETKAEFLSVAFSPDGRRLAAGNWDGTVKVWDAATWHKLYTLGDLGHVHAVAFSPDGQRLASATGHYTSTGDECAIHVWDSDSGQKVQTLSGHRVSVFCLAFSPNGERLVTAGGEEATLKVWDMTSGLEVLTLRGHADAPWGVAFSPDGRVLYSAGADWTVRVWDGTPLADGNGPALRTFAGHKARVTGVAFDRDGQRLVSSGLDHTIRVWDISTGKQLPGPPEQGQLVQCLAFSPQGNLLASANNESGDEKGLLKVWDSHTWQERHCLSLDDEGFLSIAFTPDGQKIVASSESSVVVWEMTTFQSSLVNYPHVAHLTGVAVSPYGRLAASADLNGEVRIWDLADARPVLSVLSAPPLTAALVNLHLALTAKPVRSLQAHTTRATGVAYSPKRELLATCGMDGAIQLWEPGNSRLVTLHGPESGLRCLAFSPDGTCLATGGNDATICVWDVATRRKLYTLHGHTDVVYCVTFSPDGRYIASGSLDRTVKIWKAQPPLESPFQAAASSRE